MPQTEPIVLYGEPNSTRPGALEPPTPTGNAARPLLPVFPGEET